MADKDAEAASIGHGRLIGYLCPKRPDGPLIPPQALTDPCGHDVPVYSDTIPPPPPAPSAEDPDPGWLHEMPSDSGSSDDR